MLCSSVQICEDIGNPQSAQIARQAYSRFPPVEPTASNTRARGEMRDQCPSVLEICHEFVSSKRDRFVAINRDSPWRSVTCPCC